MVLGALALAGASLDGVRWCFSQRGEVVICKVVMKKHAKAPLLLFVGHFAAVNHVVEYSVKSSNIESRTCCSSCCFGCELVSAPKPPKRGVGPEACLLKFGPGILRARRLHLAHRSGIERTQLR